jgi:hypothetical protein
MTHEVDIDELRPLAWDYIFQATPAARINWAFEMSSGCVAENDDPIESWRIVKEKVDTFLAEHMRMRKELDAHDARVIPMNRRD